MQKTDFLMLLRQKISILPQHEIEQTLEYYSEIIDDYIESGYTPEQAVAQMGGVDNVAAQVLAGGQIPVYETYGVQKRKKSGFAIAMLILGFPLWFPLLIAAFSIILALAIVLATLAIVVPWSLVVAFGASAIGLLVGTAVVLTSEGIVSAVLALGAALVFAALCVFCLWIALRLTPLAGRAIGVTFKGFFRLIFGRR